MNCIFLPTDSKQHFEYSSTNFGADTNVSVVESLVAGLVEIQAQPECLSA
jgi:hypothetical protein